LIGFDGGLIVREQQPFLSPHPFVEDVMNRRKLSIDEFAVESFETGLDPMEVTTKASSGNGCTVLTTCSPDCCDATGATSD
jgi:hypothetical protein